VNESLISLQGIGFGYPGRTVLDGVDFTLREGERVALLGGNGVGKSTLLQLMVGLLRPSSGRIHAFGRERIAEGDFREVRALAGMVFQDPDDQLFCPTVLEDVAFGPLNLGLDQAAAVERAMQTLAALGLESLAGRITHKLSGGEKRLVSLATVLAMRPRVLLLDEPGNGLDAPALQRLLGHLESLPQAMLLVSHDPRLITRLANRAVLLQDGRLHQAVLHSHPHAHEHVHLHVHVPGLESDHAHDRGPIDHPGHAHGSTSE
jgi:cobalt/nickel transport system ATP-binding protein